MKASATGCTANQIKKRTSGKQRVIAALKAGRKLSLLDSKEFELSEFHTTITNIRAEIAAKLLPYALKDEWFEFETGKRCKRYWFEEPEESEMS